MHNNICGYSFTPNIPQFVHSHFPEDLIRLLFYLELSASRADIKESSLRVAHGKDSAGIWSQAGLWTSALSSQGWGEHPKSCLLLSLVVKVDLNTEVLELPATSGQGLWSRDGNNLFWTGVHLIP